MIDIAGLIPSSPPILVALLSIAYAVVWQLSGTVILAKFLDTPYRLPLAWFLWLPLTGTLALALTLLNLTEQWLLILIQAATISTGTYLFTKNLSIKFPKLTQGALALTLTAATLQLTNLLFAAHPMRLYDQLNYHLVVAKKILLNGNPFDGTFDSHIFLSGVLEYAWLWPRALINNDLFAISTAQTLVYLSTLGTVALVVWTYMNKEELNQRVFAVSTLLVGVPSLIPNNELVHIAKPGGLLFAGTFLLLLLANRSSAKSFLTITICLSAILVATKLTALHAILALTLPLLYLLKSDAALPKPQTLLIIALASIPLLTVVIKNLITTGTFLYPADIPFFPGEHGDAYISKYWDFVAFAREEPYFQRFLGALTIPAQRPSLIVWICHAFGFFLLMHKKQKLKPDLKPIIPAALFLAAYILIWPNLYDSGIYTRFVSPYIGAIIATAAILFVCLNSKWRTHFAILTLIIGLAHSSLDVKLRKIKDWNSTTATAAMTTQWPRLETTAFINSFATNKDTIISDDPIRLFYNSTTLFGKLTPKELEIWHKLKTAPKETAKKLRLKAIILNNTPYPQNKFNVPYSQLNSIFHSLSPHGTTTTINNTKILHSPCFFKSNPCPSK